MFSSLFVGAVLAMFRLSAGVALLLLLLGFVALRDCRGVLFALFKL
jgi:hypothetical protein